MKRFLSCKCGEVLVTLIDNVTKIRSKVIIFKDNQSFVVCKGCGMELPISMSFDSEILTKNNNPKLFILQKK